MPEVLQVRLNVDVYLTWFLPLILAEEGGTIEEQYTRYIKHNTNRTYQVDR